MLMFREEKSPEDEIKAWQFWHSRQHSVKQRILDAGKFLFNKPFILQSFCVGFGLKEDRSGKDAQHHFGHLRTLSFSSY